MANILENAKCATFVEILRFRSQNNSQKIAFTFLENGEEEKLVLTYQELDLQARAIATYLQSLVLPGSRILLLYPSGLEFISAFFGCLYAGVIAVPAYPPKRNQKMSRLVAIATDAQASLILTTQELLVNIENQFSENPELAKLPLIATDSIALDKAYSWQEPSLKGSTLAFIQYTSGSTSTPKGVMVSHANLFHNEQMIQRAFGHFDEEVIVGWLPLFHDMGLVGNILQPLCLGMPSILMSPEAFLMKPIKWLQAITRYKATTSGGPNFAYDLCVRKITPEQRVSLDLSSWQLAFNGSEPVRSETLEEFALTFADCGFRKEAFYPCYGMAETTLFVSGGWKKDQPIVHNFESIAIEKNQVIKTTKEQQSSRKLVSCGLQWLDEKIIIVDPESLIQLPPNRIGEIWVASPSVAQGYWNRPKESKETFNAFLANTKEGPFLRTGDLGFLHNGELFVTGRLKDVIIIRGRNHYPQDIELTVEKSHLALRKNHGAAFAVDVDGQERLVIVQEVERSYLRKLNINEVVTAIHQAVGQQHEIQVYAILLLKTGSIPKTSSGKIQRYACRTGFLNNNLDVVADWSANPRMKTEFRDVQATVELLELQLQTQKSQLSLSHNNDVIQSTIAYNGFQSENVIRVWLVYQISEYLKAHALDINVNEIDIRKPLTSYILDSLALIEICSKLEKWLGIQLSPNIIYDYSTIASLSQHLQSLQLEKLMIQVDNLSEDEVDSLLSKLLK